MKIVFSSTVEQDEEIYELVKNLRESVLPNYMSKEELDIYEGMGLLQFAEYGNLYNGTLREAYQLMTALQIVTDLIITVSKDNSQIEDKYYDIFDRNAEKLNYFGLFFPFNLRFFQEDENMEICHSTIKQEMLM